MTKTIAAKAAEVPKRNPMLAALAGTAVPANTPPTAIEPSPAMVSPATPVVAAPVDTPSADRPAQPSANRLKKSPPPSRQNKRFMGGFFPPHVHKAMGYVMVEEDRTLQDLMEEAVHDFLVRKGQGKRLTAK